MTVEYDDDNAGEAERNQTRKRSEQGFYETEQNEKVDLLRFLFSSCCSMRTDGKFRYAKVRARFTLLIELFR